MGAGIELGRIGSNISVGTSFVMTSQADIIFEIRGRIWQIFFSTLISFPVASWAPN
jgi:hypothetical protein